MIALSGVRSSCDMLARNSDLCWLATSSSRLFCAISRKRRAFWMARDDCVAKVLSRSTMSAANAPGVFRKTVSPPIKWSSRTRGTASSARYPARIKASRTGSCSPGGANVGQLDRLAHLRQTSGRALSFPNGRRHERLHDVVFEALGCAGLEDLALLVVLVNHPGIRVGKLGGSRDDRAEHRLKVEGGADGLTDLAERLELADRAGELLRPRLQLAQQAGVLDRDHRLIGEGLEERDLVVGEPAGFAAGHRDRPDRLVVTEHRHHNQASVATDTSGGALRLRALGDRCGRRRY